MKVKMRKSGLKMTHDLVKPEPARQMILRGEMKERDQKLQDDPLEVEYIGGPKISSKRLNRSASDSGGSYRLLKFSNRQT